MLEIPNSDAYKNMRKVEHNRRGLRYDFQRLLSSGIAEHPEG